MECIINVLTRSNESKIKYKIAALNRKKYMCDHCGKYFDAGNYKQHQNRLKEVESRFLLGSENITD